MEDILYYIILLSVAFIIYIDCTNDCQIDKMSIQERDDIFYYLDYLTKILEKQNITYWIIGGTTLGAVRHNDIVPWDDDVDIGMFEKDLDKLLSINGELKKYGFEIAFSWKIYKFRKIGQEYPFIDIFCYIKEGNTYIMNRADLRNIWKNEYYLEDELFPLKKYKFGHLNVYGPNYPLDYLDRLYPNWRYIGKHTYDHKEKQWTDITIHLDYNNPEHKLKPLLYVNKYNIRTEYNNYYNEKIITIE